jgi:hypothetical protein
MLSSQSVRNSHAKKVMERASATLRSIHNKKEFLNRSSQNALKLSRPSLKAVKHDSEEPKKSGRTTRMDPSAEKSKVKGKASLNSKDPLDPLDIQANAQKLKRLYEKCRALQREHSVD